MPNYKIQPARTFEEREKIYKFRYDHYGKDIKTNQPGLSHDKQVIYEPHDDEALHFSVTDDEQNIYGIYTDLMMSSKKFPEYIGQNFNLLPFKERVLPNKIAIRTYLIFRPDFTDKNIFWKLVSMIYEYHRKNGLAFHFIYCRPHLVRFYEQLGYRRYTDNFNTGDGSYSIPMVLLSEDANHLIKIKSPFVAIASKFPKNEDHSKFFYDTFPKFITSNYTNLMDQEELWNVFYTSIVDSEEKPIPEIFNNLSKDEIYKILHKPVLLDVQKGDKIIRRGEMANEAYVALEGVYSVEMTKGIRKFTLQTLGPGEIFGEMAHFQKSPRTADVIALTNGKVLVLNNSFFNVIREINPDLPIKILNNLLAILARRLTETTKQVMESVDVEFLRGCEIFKGLKSSDIKIITEFFKIQEFQKGEILFKQNDLSRDAYLILDGQLSVRLLNVKNESKFTIKSNPGELIGEFSLIDGRPRSAEVYAVDNTRTLALEKECMDRILTEFPQIGYQIMSNISKILVSKVRKSNEQMIVSLEWGDKTQKE